MAGKPTKGIKREGNWGGRMQSVSTGTCSIICSEAKMHS